MKTIFFAAITFVLTVSGVSVASAQGNAGSGAGASGSLQVGAEVNTEVETGIRVDKASPKLQEASTKGSAGEGDPDRPTTSDSIESSSSAGGNTVSTSAVEVRGWDPKQKQEFLATVKAHAEVRSGQDLENFATGVLLRDENVEEIKADEERVEVSYRMPAKFLGILDASLVARAEVDAEGRVKVRYPWFGFLFAKTVSGLEFETELKAALPEVGDEVLVSFEAQARVITTLSNVMKAKHDTAMAAIQNTR